MEQYPLYIRICTRAGHDLDKGPDYGEADRWRAIPHRHRYSAYKDLCTYAKYDEYTYGQYVVEYGVHMKLYEGP